MSGADQVLHVEVFSPALYDDRLSWRRERFERELVLEGKPGERLEVQLGWPFSNRTQYCLEGRWFDFPVTGSLTLYFGEAIGERHVVFHDTTRPDGSLDIRLKLRVAEREYDKVRMIGLDVITLAPDIEVAFEQDGPHLPAKNMTSTVYVLRRT